MNKRGILGLGILGFAVAVLILTAIGAFFYFSENFRFLVIGIGFIAATLVYVVPSAMNGNLTKNKVGLIAILISIGILFILVPSLQQTFSPVSITNVDITGQGQRVLVYARTGGGSALDLELSPTTLNSFIRQDGYQATQTARLSADYQEATLDFVHYTTEDNPVYLLNTPRSITSTCAVVGDCLTACRNAGYPNTVAIIFGATRPQCVERRINGFVHDFTSTINGGFSVLFDLDGEQARLTQNANSITMANGRVRINFEGNLLTVNQLSRPSDQIFSVGTSAYLIAPGNYGRVQTAYNSFTQCIINARLSGNTISQNDYNACQSEYYRIVNQNIVSNDQNFMRTNANIEGISFSQGVMRVNLREPNFLPTFTIEVEGTRVGLVRLSGEPDIISCVDDTVFDRSGSRSVNAVVRNVATSPGTFNFVVTCTNPLFNAAVLPSDFNANQQKTVGIQLSGSSSGTSDSSGRCTLTVTDRNSQRSDSCTFDFTVEYFSGIEGCTAADNRCSEDGQATLICQSGDLIATSCINGCYLQGAEPRCAPDPDENGPSGPENIQTECTQRRNENPLLGYEYVESTSSSCGYDVFCYLGITDPKQTTTARCVATFVPYYIVGFVIIIIAVIVMALFYKPRKRRK